MFCAKQTLGYYAYLSSFVHKPYSYAAQLQILAPASMSGRGQQKSSERKKRSAENPQSVDDDIQSAGASGEPSYLERRPRPEPLEAIPKKSSKSPTPPTPPTAEFVALVSKKRLAPAQDDDDESIFSPGVPVKKRKIVGGSITMKDGAIALRHFSVMTRGNMIARDQNVRDCFFKGVGNFTFKLKRFVHLKSTFKALEGSTFTDFIDINVRGNSCRTWLNSSLKAVHSELSDTFGRPGRFKNASKNTQIVFAYDGSDPYWDHFPQRTEMQNLKEWQKSFFLEGDWMVSEVVGFVFLYILLLSN